MNDKIDKKDLTNPDKSYSIWLQLNAKAQNIQFGYFMCKVIVHNGSITEVQHWPARESIRADG